MKRQSFREAVENALFTGLTSGEPKQQRIAKALGVSTSTLVRRLAEEGASFSELLDNARRNLACRYLPEPGVSIDQIALLLGYNEVQLRLPALERDRAF